MTRVRAIQLIIITTITIIINKMAQLIHSYQDVRKGYPEMN
jgi:hypothetical protein